MVALDPGTGAEARMRRPAVLVSNDGANRMAEEIGRGTVTVVPRPISVLHAPAAPNSERARYLIW